jgi:hypothetical protein
MNGLSVSQSIRLCQNSSLQWHRKGHLAMKVAKLTAFIFGSNGFHRSLPTRATSADGRRADAAMGSFRANFKKEESPNQSLARRHALYTKKISIWYAMVTTEGL